MGKLTTKQMYEVIRMYNGGISLKKITEIFSITRQAIYLILKKKNVPKKRNLPRVRVVCKTCGIEFYKPSWRIYYKNKFHYCSKQCFYCYLTRSNTINDANGRRAGRILVSKHFNLDPKHIVHHKDKNNKNNKISNLQVFLRQKHHARHHYGHKERPIWDGSWVE